MPDCLIPSLEYASAELLPQSVLDAAPFGAFITDDQFKLVQVNQWVLSHIRKPASDILYRPINEIFPEIFDRNLVEAYRLVMRSRSSITISHRIHHHLVKMPSVLGNGAEDMPQTAMIVPILQNNQLAGTLTYILDLTERINSERVLQQEVNKLVHLHEIDLALSTLNLNQCLDVIVSRSHQLFHACSTSLFLSESGKLRLVASKDEDGSGFVYQNSAIEQAVSQKASILIPENSKDKRFQMTGSLVQMEMSAPLLIANECIGVLAVQTQQRNAYDSNDLTLLDMLASRAATAIHNARLHDAERSQRQLSEALYQVSLALTSQHDSEAILNDLLDQMVKVIPYDSACLMLLENSRVMLKQVRGQELWGLSDLMQRGAMPLADFAVLQMLAETGKPHCIPAAQCHPLWKKDVLLPHGLSWIGAPIVIRNEVMGFITLSKRLAGFYSTETEKNLAAFAALAGVTIENSRLLSEQERLARTDGLTGLANRRRFDEALVYEINRAKRHHHPISLILFDIDNFKRYNDTYGHQAGDHLLKNLAALFSAQLRCTDIFARYGGEEFVVILPETDLKVAMAVAERLRTIMESIHVDTPLAEFPIPNQPVTISLGIGSLGDHTQDGAALIKEADAALYYAKETGRNRVVVLACSKD